MTLWDAFNDAGTVAFATSGALVAMEEGYDLVGVLFLGLAASFGGGILRDVLLGLPVGGFWHQGSLLEVAVAAMGVLWLTPGAWIRRWSRLETALDAVGLASFAVQAAVRVHALGQPAIAVVLASALTGAGGGIIRDLLARRQPAVFRPSALYSVWAMGAGAAVAMGYPTTTGPLLALAAVVAGGRMASVILGWHLPARRIQVGPTPPASPPVSKTLTVGQPEVTLPSSDGIPR